MTDGEFSNSTNIELSAIMDSAAFEVVVAPLLTAFKKHENVIHT